MFSDETYLESFVDTLTTLPHELRRSMDLLRVMSMPLETLQDHHAQYIRAAEEKLMQLEVVVSADGETLGVRVGDQIVVPTTDELMEYTMNEDKYDEILKLQAECYQIADEKVAIAQQAYEMMDATVLRLDQDIQAMELLLQVSRISLSKRSGRQQLLQTIFENSFHVFHTCFAD
jgi:hypothetical protein